MLGLFLLILKLSLSAAVDVAYGSSIILYCSLAIPDNNVCWQKKAQQTNWQFLYYQKTFTIQNAIFEDSGTYRCLGYLNQYLYGREQVVVVKGTPKLSVSSQVNAIYSGQVTLQCTVSTNTYPSVSLLWWTRQSSNGTWYSITSNNVKYNGGYLSSPSLIIYNIQYTDEGAYRCYAENELGSGYAETFLDVGEIPTVETPVPKYYPQRGKTVNLECIAGNSHSVSWRKEVGGTLYPDSNSKYIGGTTANPSLTVTNVQWNDDGKYYCKGTNKFGWNEAMTEIISGSPPMMTISNSILYVVRGNNVVLDVTIQSNSTLVSVVWTKQPSTTINPSDKYKIQNNDLTVMNVQESDDGNYTCSATNIFGSTSADVQIISGYIPQITALNYTAQIGTSTELKVTITAIYPAVYSVQWQKNGEYIQLGGRYTGGTTNIPSLTINPVEVNDDGTYRCTISNGVGTSYVELSLLTRISGVNIPLEEYVAKVGDTFILECLINSSLNNQSVKWYKDKVNLQIIGRYSGGSLDNPSLTLSDVQIGDAGVYKCEVSTPVENSEDIANLTVLFASVFSKTISKTTNDTVTLTCNATGGVTLKWKRNGEYITTTDSDVYGGGTIDIPSLTITRLTRDHAGNYTCETSYNSVTAVSKLIHLVVEDSKSNTRENETKAGPIVGGIVAGVLAFLILAFLLFRWKRNTQRNTDYETQHWRANEDHMYTEPTPGHLYSNSIADNALNSSSEQLDKKSNEENNIILGKIDAPMLTEFLQDKHSKKDVLQREFRWLHLNKTSRTETVDKYVSTDDKRGQTHTYYNSIDSSLESNRNIHMMDKGQRSIIQELPGQENVESFWQMVDDFEVECIILIVQKKEKIPDFYPVTDESLELQTLNIELSGAEKFENVFVYSFKIHNKVKRSHRYIKVFKTSDWKENQKYPSVEQLCSLLVNVDKGKSTPLVIIGSKPYGFPTCGVVSVCLEVMMAIEKDQMFSILELVVFVSAERDLFTYFEEYELCYNLIQHYLETAHTYDLIE